MHQKVETAIVVSNGEIDPSQASTQLALFTTAGAPINLDETDAVPQTGANVLLTGYTAGAADDVEATDTVNAALAKLEARIAAVEAEIA